MFRKLRHSIIKRLARLAQSVWDSTRGWPQLIKRVTQVSEMAKKQRDEIRRVAQRGLEIKEMIDGHRQASSEIFTVPETLAAMNKRLSAARHAASRMGTAPSSSARSVVFIEQSYYHFYYLARALRARGWDAQLACFHNPSSKWTRYFHGQDILLWSDDPESHRLMREEFFNLAIGRFQMAHFSGDDLLSMRSPDQTTASRPDLDEWRAHGKFVGFTISGCNTGVSKQTVGDWSRHGGSNVCETCVWDDRPDVCAPEKSLNFGKMLETHCSLVCGEAVPRLDYMNLPCVISEPLTMCLDEHFWSPDLQVPERFRIDNPAGEILIYHGMGEKDSRSDGRKNIKGTHAITLAVERLREEGHPVRFVFATGMSNRDVRFMQVQADIIVDQLNYGRYGAQAREGMMLAKPVICYINKHEVIGEPLSLWNECPLVSASEQTVYEELKRLVMDAGLRRDIGHASRAYAMKWHSPTQCARRYEMVYDELLRGTLDFSSLVRTTAWRDGDRSS